VTITPPRKPSGLRVLLKILLRNPIIDFIVQCKVHVFPVSGQSQFIGIVSVGNVGPFYQNPDFGVRLCEWFIQHVAMIFIKPGDKTLAENSVLFRDPVFPDSLPVPAHACLRPERSLAHADRLRHCQRHPDSHTGLESESHSE